MDVSVRSAISVTSSRMVLRRSASLATAHQYNHIEEAECNHNDCAAGVDEGDVTPSSAEKAN
jgi:hypothetical protein